MDAKVELSCGCGCAEFSWEPPLKDSTVMTCTKCGRSATKKAIVAEAAKQAMTALEKAFRKGLR